ncbi:MAG: HesA/MoeB/ThiF family protein, partial [Litorimonas sp.]
MNPDQIKRYARHLVLKEIGGAGQNALLAARIAIVGAGGLGGPVGLYLAAAGIGHITIIDDDVVDMSNLQRQVQFTTSDIGESKAALMASKLAHLDPDITTQAQNCRLTPHNAKELLSDHDIILDAVDGFASRFAINDAALALKTPLISGALGRFNGHVSIFGAQQNAPCYRCLVPEIPPDEETCAVVGVVGALAGVIGSVMAMEAIKLVTKAGQSLDGRL